MTIENSLERIAIALEKLAGEAPVPSGKPKAPAAEKPKAPAAPAKPPAAKPTSGADTAGASDNVGKDELRAILVAFQEEQGADAARDLIQPWGKTIGKIKPTDYFAVSEAVKNYGT